MEAATQTTPISTNGNGSHSAASTTKKRTLLDIRNDYSDFFELLEAIDLEEVSDDDQARLNAFLETLDKERDKKLDNIGAYIKDLQARAKARKQIVDEMQSLYKTDTNKVTWLKNLLLNFFTDQKIEKAIDTVRCKFWTQRNSQATLTLPEAVKERQFLFIDEETLAVIPEQYRKQVWVVNTAPLREDLEANLVVQERVEQIRKQMAEIQDDSPIFKSLSDQLVEAEKQLIDIPFATLEYGRHIRIK